MTKLTQFCFSWRWATLYALGLWTIGSSSACSHKQLDASFGQRNREIFRVQTSARNGREVIAHGQEVDGAVGKYYLSISPSENDSKPTAPAPSTLKFPSMH